MSDRKPWSDESKKRLSAAKTKHGHVGTRVGNKRIGRTSEYHSWVAMCNRCHNPNQASYIHYGARGIFVCDEWRKSFSQFLSDMGLKPTNKHTIERIDNNKGYNPDNCRWATRSEQNNNARSNRQIEYNGKKFNTISSFAKYVGINYHTMLNRINNGWDIADAATFPVDASVSYSKIKLTK